MFTILVPLDGSPLAEQALAPAQAIARDLDGRVELVLVHTPDPFARRVVVQTAEQPLTLSEEYLQRVAVSVRASGLSDGNVFYEVVSGNEVDAICEHARHCDADLVVMTTHGRTGFNRLWLGSVADGVVRNSPVPVLLMRAREAMDNKPRVPPRDFLIPVDGSKLAEQIVDPVLAEASDTVSKLTLLRVVQPVPQMIADPTAGLAVMAVALVDDQATKAAVTIAETYVEQLANRIRGRRPRVFVETRVIVDERVAHAIIATADEVQADAIAMTTRGRGASRLVVGSIADKVLRGANVPLLVFHARARMPLRARRRTEEAVR